jgi:hypothetical protein
MFAKRRATNHFYNGSQGQMMNQVPMGYPQNQLPYTAQPIPFQHRPQKQEWSLIQRPGPFYPQGFQPYTQSFYPGPGPQQLSYQNQYALQKDSQFLFQNPLQPKEEMITNPYLPINGFPIMNPYPKQSFIPKPPNGIQSIMNSFKSQDGSVDFNKMMNTAGQMVNAVTQVSSLVKGLGGIFKT